MPVFPEMAGQSLTRRYWPLVSAWLSTVVLEIAVTLPLTIVYVYVSLIVVAAAAAACTCRPAPIEAAYPVVAAALGLVGAGTVVSALNAAAPVKVLAPPMVCLLEVSTSPVDG